MAVVHARLEGHRAWRPWHAPLFSSGQWQCCLCSTRLVGLWWAGPRLHRAHPAQRQAEREQVFSPCWEAAGGAPAAT
eukprot:15413173-Alexandrium_andersonii.AAC.1